MRVAKRVYVIDNGGTPFVVELSSLSGPGTARILRNRGADEPGAGLRTVDLQDRYFEPWRAMKYDQAWVGLDPDEGKKPSFLQRVLRTTPAWWHGGNSVLLRVARSKYVCVGWDIFSFTATDGISTFVSPMGNNAVPYPYAIGSNNTYLTADKAFIPNEWVPEGADPYDVYYELEQSRSKLDKAKVAGLKLTGVRILHKRHEPW
jgi:hypothetical protein